MPRARKNADRPVALAADAKGLTLKALAAQVGIDAATLSRIVSGQRRPTRTALDALCQALDRTAEELQLTASDERPADVDPRGLSDRQARQRQDAKRSAEARAARKEGLSLHLSLRLSAEEAKALRDNSLDGEGAGTAIKRFAKKGGAFDRQDDD